MDIALSMAQTGPEATVSEALTLLALAAVAIGLFGVAHSFVHPWRKCRWCGGTGKRFSHVWSRRTFHVCWCCHGAGKHRRWARRPFDRR